MAKRYRCTNCNSEFVAEKPVCAVCEIDATTDPVVQGVILPLVVIHYDPPHPKIKRRGRGHRACDPSVPIGRGRGSGEARAVNCEACKNTPEFAEAVKAGLLETNLVGSEDEYIQPANGVIVTKKTDCGC